MNPSSAPTCPKCHAVLPTDAPAGLCPRCIMALNFTGDTVTDGAPQQAAPTPEELAPHFPQIEIIECLGRGGMGVVYKARQTSLGRLVALKLLAPERVGDAKFAERFAQEAKALAALNHPNIVTIHDFGQAGGFFYLLMEFVDGVNLRQAMKAGRFTPEEALAVVPPVCEALQYAHEHGVVHRDIKPENLLLDKDGRVKIADFGVAKMLHADDPNISVEESQPAGTPQYMAPEQKAHRRTDHRADIYSLGVVLYELLTGELPAAKLQPPSRRVQIDVRLDEIVLRALEQTPELRYQTAREFRTQVETIAEGAAATPAAHHPKTGTWSGWGIVGTALGATSWMVLTAIASSWHGAGLALTAATTLSVWIVAFVLWRQRDCISALSGIMWMLAVGIVSSASFLVGADWLGLVVRSNWPTAASMSPLHSMWILGVFPVIAVWLWIRDRSEGQRIPPESSGKTTAGASPRSSGWLLAARIAGLVAPMLVVGLILVAKHQSRVVGIVTPSYTLVRLEKNMVVLDFQAVVSHGTCAVEMNLGGTGSTVTAATTVNRPEGLGSDTDVITPDQSGSARTLNTGITKWRVAFVLPTESLAREAWENLQPLGPLQVLRDRKTGGAVFEVKAPTGATYTALFLAGPIGPQIAVGDEFPRGAHIGGNDHSVVVKHDNVDAHYVFYYAGDFESSSSGSQNKQTRSWTDEGAVKLKNGRTFGYRRIALYPDELTVNGARYDLLKGRVFVLRDDGTLEQLPVPVSLSVARDPVALGALLKERGGETSGAAASPAVKKPKSASVTSPLLDARPTPLGDMAKQADPDTASDEVIAETPSNIPQGSLPSPGKPDELTPIESQLIDLAHEQLSFAQAQLASGTGDSLAVIEAEGELAIAKAVRNPLRQAEARVDTATRVLELKQALHGTGKLSREAVNQALGRKLSAELELQRLRSAQPPTTNKKAGADTAPEQIQSPEKPAANLHRREVRDKTPDGRDIAMIFEELKRDEKTSVAAVKSVGGGSVASAMFIARGAYDIAKARGAAYFINLKEWDGENGARMYLIGFAQDTGVDPKTYFDLKEPLPADKQLHFFSVSVYDRLFKDQP